MSRIRKPNLLAFLLMLYPIFFPTAVQALPGWKASQIRAWITNHTFLAPNFRDLVADTTWSITAHRDIENDEQVRVEYEGGGVYVPKTHQVIYPPEYVFPQVKVSITNRETLATKANIWARHSESSRIILGKVYGRAVAEDYSQSKFVYKEHEYVTESSVTYSYRRRGSILEVPTQSGEVFDEGEVQFFQGKQFAYEVDSKNAVLTIFFLKDLSEEIAIMQNNAKMYAIYAQRESRKKPTALKFEMP